jgi:hypothetical protein
MTDGQMSWFPIALPGKSTVVAESERERGIVRDHVGQIASIHGRPAPSISPRAIDAFAFLDAYQFQLVGIMALSPWVSVQVLRFQSPTVRCDLVCVFHTWELEGPLLTRLTEPHYQLALDEAIPFNLRFGQIDVSLRRVASWLEDNAADALAGEPDGFEHLQRLGARPSKPHNWDEVLRQYDP